MDLVPLNSIFEIVHGHGLDMNKMSPCGPGEDAVAFINRSEERNGFVGFVERLDLITPFESGQITVALGGSALASFVQPCPFYTAQNIDVLKPRSPMPLDVKLYYCLCIAANRFRYSTFGREANRTLKFLEVPSLRNVPAWVKGSAKTSVNEFSRELMELIEIEDTTAIHISHKASHKSLGSVATLPSIEVGEEDMHDADVARSVLARVGTGQSNLVTGSELNGKLNELLS